MDFAIPQSKIASLSSGEFVGMVADDPNEKIKLKTFHCEIVNDHKDFLIDQNYLTKLPYFKEIKQEMIIESYIRIKKEVKYIINYEIEILTNSLDK